MNDELTYQNQDLSNQNPFTPRNPVSEPDSAQPSKPKLIVPSDPKIKLLIVLGVIVAILSVLSIIVTIYRKSKPVVTRPTTPVVTQAPIPTDIPDTTSIPNNLQVKFEDAFKDTQIIVNFNPPQIDTTVGL